MPRPRIDVLSYLLFLACVPAGACKSTPLDWQGSPSETELHRYKDSYYRALGDRFVGTVDREDFVKAIRRARVLFLGDHHRDPVLHARILSLLQDLDLAGIQPVLGLEAVGEQDEEVVRLYLEGASSLAELRSTTLERWPDSWLDSGEVDSDFYRSVLELARDRHWPVFGLEPTPRLPLELRDAAMSANIRKAADKHPDRALVVIVGQAHLLGQGCLIQRVGLPHVAVGASLSPDLMERVPVVRHDDYFMRSSSGVLFFSNSSN